MKFASFAPLALILCLYESAPVAADPVVFPFSVRVTIASGPLDDLFGRSFQVGDELTGRVTFDGISAQEFFNLLLATTMQGFFADPVYGGNRDKVAWKMIGFPGVVAIYSEHIKTYRNKKYDVEPKSILDLS